MPSRSLLVLLLGFVVGLSPFAIDMYLPGMPSIQSDLGTTPEAVQLTLSVYLIFFSLPQLLFGPWADAIGRRPTVIFGLVLYCSGAAICALAPNIEWLMLGRAVQATGSAAMVVTVPALVKDRFDNADYTSTMGFIMMVMALAPLVAPIAGGFILHWGWRVIFATLVVLGMACSALFYLKIPETLPPGRRTPFKPRLIWRGYRTLFLDPYCLLLTLAASFLFAGLMTFITGSSFVYIEYYSVDEQLYGLLFAVNVLAMMALTFTNNRLVYRLANERLLKASGISISLATIVLLTLSQADRPRLLWVVAASALFIGNMGMLTANVMAIIMRRYAYMAGATAAFTGAVRFATASLGGVLISVWHSGNAVPMLLVMALFGGLCVISLLAAFYLSARDSALGPSQQ